MNRRCGAVLCLCRLSCKIVSNSCAICSSWRSICSRPSRNSSVRAERASSCIALAQISTPDQRSRPKACAESHHGVQIRIEFIARARRPRYAPAHPQLVRPRLRGAATLPQSVSDSDRCLTYISPPTGGNWLLTAWTISTHAALQPLRAIFCSSIGSATSLTPNDPITFRTVSNSGFAVSLKVL
jgi:hypothetical protein